MNNDSQPQSSGFNWGKGLTVAIVLFICSTLGVVGYIVSLDYHMVTENHYEKAVNYQQHIERLEQASAMKKPVEIELLRKDQRIEIRFPSSLKGNILSGTIELYRPNDSSKDRKIQLILDQSGIQQIEAQNLAKGKWLVKVNWSSENKNYYKQQSIFI